MAFFSKRERTYAEWQRTLKYTLCQLIHGYTCPICGHPYFLLKNFKKCCPVDRERRDNFYKNPVFKGAPAHNEVVSHSSDHGPSPYPGGPKGPAGFVEGAHRGGYYPSESPYPGGPNGPGGFVPNSGYVSFGQGGEHRQHDNK